MNLQAVLNRAVKPPAAAPAGTDATGRRGRMSEAPAPDLPAARRGWRRLWQRLRHASRARDARRQVAEQLYHAVVKQARRPVWYRELGVPDTPEGRFEMIALHAALVLRRLRREGMAGQALGQLLFDAMFVDLDGSLRELGVSDLSVGKYIKRLAGNFYARLAALDEGLGERQPDGAIAPSDAARQRLSRCRAERAPAHRAGLRAGRAGSRPGAAAGRRAVRRHNRLGRA